MTRRGTGRGAKAPAAETPAAKGRGGEPGRAGGKLPHDISTMLGRIREAIRPYPKAAMFELAERGHRSLFEQLVACIVSIRTLDEVSLPAALRLFERASTPEAVARLDRDEIARLIRPSTFFEAKAGQIRQIARRAVAEHRGELPCDAETLLGFAGVGPKCAHLALGIACGEPRISVDVHVHRVTNRWGYVRAAAPEHTMAALEERLPRRYWIEINALLVPFGKHVCTRALPRCSTCPVLEWCRQVGVEAHR